MNHQPSTLREELHPLLAARIRVGAVLVGVSIALYGLLEVWQQRAPLGPFFAIKTVQVITVVAVWLAVGWSRQWWRTVALALVLVAEIGVTLAVSGILTGEVASAPLLFVLLVLGCATLLPWGLGPQAATVGVAAAALVLNAWLVPVPEGFGYTATAACLAFIASLCVAYELEQQRRQRHRAEREERDSAGALREEIFVAEASTHAARELLATRSTADVLGTLCRLETRLLACDASYTFTRDSNDAKAFVAVAADGDSGTEWISRRALRIPDIGLARMLDRLDRDEPFVVGEAQGVLLPVEGCTGVCTALFAGRDVIGIQVAVRRQARPFSSADIELARRLAHTASAAIAQARLLEAPDHPRAVVATRVWRELQTPLSSILRLAERAGDSSLPASERRALIVRITSTARDTLHLLERLEHGGTARENDGTAHR